MIEVRREYRGLIRAILEARMRVSGSWQSWLWRFT